MYNYSYEIYQQLVQLNVFTDKIFSVLVCLLFFSVSLFMISIMRWFKR